MPMYSSSASSATTRACATMKAWPSALGAIQPENRIATLSSAQTALQAIITQTASRGRLGRDAASPTSAAKGKRLSPAWLNRGAGRPSKPARKPLPANIITPDAALVTASAIRTWRRKGLGMKELMTDSRLENAAPNRGGDLPPVLPVHNMIIGRHDVD